MSFDTLVENIRRSNIADDTAREMIAEIRADKDRIVDLEAKEARARKRKRKSADGSDAENESANVDGGGSGDSGGSAGDTGVA